MAETANIPIPVTDVTDKIYLSISLGSGRHKDVRIDIAGAGTNILVLLSKETGHKQYLIDINQICGELAEGFHNETA